MFTFYTNWVVQIVSASIFNTLVNKKNMFFCKWKSERKACLLNLCKAFVIQMDEYQPIYLNSYPSVSFHDHTKIKETKIKDQINIITEDF